MSVTLKELRISKGLNQAHCAKYLGMSTRNYQNYENGFLTLTNARVLYECCHGYGLAGVGKQRGKVRQA